MNIYIYTRVCVCIQKATEREELELNLLSRSFLPKWWQQSGLSQVEARIWELQPGFPHRCQGPSTLLNGKLEGNEAAGTLTLW